MTTQLSPKASQRVIDRRKRRRRKKKVVNRLVENKLIGRVSYDEYRERVRTVYDGPKGAMLATCSFLSLHTAMGNRLFRGRKFDLRGARHILDVGSGAGQMIKHLLRYADPGVTITGFDLSPQMLRRARNRIKSDIPKFVAADLTRLPFADASFDCVTCGYVLEHLPDARLGLAELSRAMTPGGRMLLLTTEDNFGGAWTSRIFCCRTYNRHDLQAACEELGLHWNKEIWFTPMHRALRAGGICVELVKR